jgi:hypothetical protein
MDVPEEFGGMWQSMEEETSDSARENEMGIIMRMILVFG